MSVLEELALESSPFPTVDLAAPGVPDPGLVFETPKLCRKVFSRGDCARFYESLRGTSGRKECPFGFSVWPGVLGNSPIALTGVIATPRSGSRQERLRAREVPNNHVAADAAERWLERLGRLVTEGDQARDREFSRRLEALHEIRKLNQIVRTNMERVCTEQSADKNDPDSAPRDLVRAHRASSLISVQLDALDILATSSTAPLPFEARRWVFYRVVDKLVRIYRVLADSKNISIRFVGSSVTEVLIDQRTIHIIPSAFIDNAIKYSPAKGTITISVSDEEYNRWPVVALRVDSEGPSATIEEERSLFVTRGRGAAARAAAEGTGAGLALAKVVADQHHADLTVRQERIPGTERSRWLFACLMPVAT